MAYTFLSVGFNDGKVLGGLPLEITGTLSSVLKDFGSGEFSLPLNDPLTPDDWEDLTAPRKVMILVLDEDYNIIWSGVPNDDMRSSTAALIKIPCVTPEAHFANIYAGTATYVDADQVSGIALGLAKMAGDSANFEYDCPPAGTVRTEIYLDEEDATVLDRLKALANTIDGFEFRVDVEWVDNTYSQVRKVFRAKHRRLGNITDTPDHAFEMPGNVTNYEFSRPRVNGAYATRVTATGDGEGIHKVRSNTLVDTAAEAAGAARYDYRRNFPGVTDSVTINAIAQALFKKVTGGQDLITLTVRSDGPTKLQDLRLGDTATIDINTIQLNINEVWRVVGFELSNTADEYKPILALMAEDATDFILRQTPIDLITGVIKDVNLGISQDNLKQGYTWTSPDGAAFKLGTGFDAGMYSPNGAFSPLFDSNSSNGFGSAFGGNGSSFSSKSGIGTLQSVDIANHTCTVLMDGATTPISARLSAEKIDWAVGDIVPVMDASPTPIVVNRERMATTPTSPPTNYRISQDWPKNATDYNLCYGPAFMDSTGVFLFGADAVIIDSQSLNNVYTVQGGNVASIGIPAGFSYIANAIQIYNNNGYKWFSDSSNYPRMFKRDNNAVGGWKKLDNMPTSPGTFADGAWGSTSMTKEVWTRPVAVSAKITQSQTKRYSDNDHRIPVEVTVHALNNTDTMDVNTFPMEIKTSIYAQSAPVDLNPSTIVNIITHGSGNHIFFSITVQNFVQNSGSSTANNMMFYASLSDTVMKLTQLFDGGGDAFATWVGSKGPIRSSDDGMLYAAAGGFLSRRILTDIAPLNSEYDLIPQANIDAAYGAPQRDRNTTRFFIAADVMPLDSGTRGFSGCVYNHEATSGSTTISVARQGESPSGTRSALISFPYQMPDNSIIANLDLSNNYVQTIGVNQGTNHSLERIEPF